MLSQNPSKIPVITISAIKHPLAPILYLTLLTKIGSTFFGVFLKKLRDLVKSLVEEILLRKITRLSLFSRIIRPD
jgi:hypothetical protein